jgi:hypothetical protein
MLSDYVGWQNINHPNYILIILQQYLGYVNNIVTCTRGSHHHIHNRTIHGI